MSQDDFVSLVELKRCIVNRKVTVTKQPVNWFSIRWIRVTKDKPFAFKYRNSLNELEGWKEVNVRRKRQGRPVDMGRVTLTPLFIGPCPIKKVKIHNLLSLLAYVPPVYHEFHESIRATNTSRDDEDSDEQSSDSGSEDDSD